MTGVFAMDKSSAAENSTTEVIFRHRGNSEAEDNPASTYTMMFFINPTLTLISIRHYAITFSHHPEGRLKSRVVLSLKTSLKNSSATEVLFRAFLGESSATE